MTAINLSKLIKEMKPSEIVNEALAPFKGLASDERVRW